MQLQSMSNVFNKKIKACSEEHICLDYSENPHEKFEFWKPWWKVFNF